MSQERSTTPSPSQPLRIGYQGEPGAFGEQAARARGAPVPFATFAALLQALREGAVDAVALPVENAVVGAISEALVPLAEALGTGLAIEGAGTTTVAIQMSLAAAPGVKAGELQRVRSHPAALRQCQHRLRQLGLVPVEALDTAGAAWQLSRDVAAGLPEARREAVLCSAFAARAAGLAILEEDLSDQQPNSTRFVHLRRALPAPAPRQGSTLPDLRARIDAIDAALAALLLQRLLTARAVGEIKKQTGTPVLDAAREAEVRSSLRGALQGRAALADQLADLLLSAGRAEQGD